MGRVKIFASVAVLGFLAGLLAQAAGQFLIPWLAEVLPMININYLVSGVVGAVVTVGFVTVWAYMTDNKQKF
jgi:hypothetical protein